MSIWQRRAGCVAMAGVAILASSPAGGELLRFDAVLETHSQEFVDGQAVSFDQSFEQFELTSADLPLRVASGLILPTADGAMKATAQGFADFFEPIVDRPGNPAELALEANVFSIDPAVAYTTSSSIEEVRTVRFSRRELVDLAVGEREVLSDVFLSGSIIVWSQDPLGDLSGLSGVMEFVVEQVRTTRDPQTSEMREEVVPLWVTRMGVNGRAGGSVDPFIEGLGTFLFGGPDLVRDLAGPNAPPDDMDGMGRVWIMLVPSQVLTYSYRARAGEEFKLQASFSVEVSNLPDGTGVSAVFGRDFEGLGRIIEQAFGDLNGQSTQRAINLALAKAPSPEPQRVPSTNQANGGAGRSAPMCGTLGGLGLAVVALSAFLVPVRRRRRC
ncbi:MAG: hypothetical protein ACE5GE_03300 [Phycisphaerae bacterium]